MSRFVVTARLKPGAGAGASRREARRLVTERGVFRQISRLGHLVQGTPKMPVEVFGWERPAGPPA